MLHALSNKLTHQEEAWKLRMDPNSTRFYPPVPFDCEVAASPAIVTFAQISVYFSYFLMLWTVSAVSMPRLIFQISG